MEEILMSVWRGRRARSVTAQEQSKPLAEIVDPHERLGREIRARMQADRLILDRLRHEIQPLLRNVRPLQAVSATSISLVAADGGNNALAFDPFLVQVVRIVDSSNNEYCLEAITPTTNVSELGRQQFYPDGTPKTALGKMMAYLHVRDLPNLSSVIRRNDGGRPVSPGWVRAYRELVEWAILFSIVREKDFATDTLVVFDGLLRSKIFAGTLFKRYLRGLQEGIDRQRRQQRRLYLAGVAKHSKVLARYRLAMALEGVLTTHWPAYVEVPRDIEERAYIWSEYARGDDQELEGRGVNRSVGGKMFFAKFGRHPHDPIWPIDILESQRAEATHILGCLLTDALVGFPVPFYPQCLQRAHEHAAMVDFDFAVLQDQVYEGIRDALGPDAVVLDGFRLQETDPAARRYGRE